MTASSDNEKPDHRLSEDAQMRVWKQKLANLPRSRIAPGDYGLYSPERQRRAQRRLIRNGLPRPRQIVEKVLIQSNYPVSVHGVDRGKARHG